MLGRGDVAEMVGGAPQRRDKALRLRPGGRAHAEGGDGDVLGEQLEVDVIVVAHQLGQAVAGRSGAPHVDREAQRVPPGDPRAADHALVEDVEAGDGANRLTGVVQALDRLGEQGLPVDLCLAAAGVERAAEQPAGAGRLDQADTAVDHLLVDPLGGEVEHRRLGEAADDLVGGGDHQVGAARDRVGRQVGVEAQMRSPGLVDDQGQVPGMGNLGEAARRRRRPRSRWGRPRPRRPRPAWRRGPPPAPRASCSVRHRGRGRARGRRRRGAGRRG